MTVACDQFVSFPIGRFLLLQKKSVDLTKIDVFDRELAFAVLYVCGFFLLLLFPNLQAHIGNSFLSSIWNFWNFSLFLIFFYTLILKFSVLLAVMERNVVKIF